MTLRPVAPQGQYAAWRPLMENHLLRAGITTRDYKEAIADWAALVTAVEDWSRADENASIAHALGRGSSSSKAGPSAAEKEMRRGATELVSRVKKAYALLYQALSEDLRRLVEHVTQGDAHALWLWLEKRFQSTEQDNIGDLWDQFTTLSQNDDESFDEYKARVDRVFNLLSLAKDKPSMGQYAHRLLWKLSSRYKQAVLALKAGDKLKDADKIVWDEIVAFVNNYERSEQRLSASDAATDGSVMSATSVPADRRRTGRGGAVVTHGSLAGIECFNCNKMGHLARNCREPRRARRQDDDDSHATSNAGRYRSDDEQDDGDGRDRSRHSDYTKNSHVGRGDKNFQGRAMAVHGISGETDNDGGGIGRPRQMARCSRRGGPGGTQEYVGRDEEICTFD
jgi:hypothetical protein